MCNNDIREKIKFAGVRYWQVAGELGVSDGNFSRMLRRELPDDKKTQILEAIDRLTKEA